MAPDLPVQLTSYIGRKQEVADVVRLLAEVRLLTITGTGGIGKTRLAIEVARGAATDEAWFVELAPLLEGTLVPSAIASVLGVAEVSGEPLLDTVAGFLRERPGLLVLDNCEHLVVGSAATVERLLEACSSLTVLATSRETLNVPGEVVCRVLPLTPGEGAALFIDRATAAEPGFRRSRESAGAIEGLCEQLDGLPLAIELAAACVRMLTVPEITARLGERLDLLASRGRTVTGRHQTLRALVDWSYELLPPEEQQLYRRLSVFAGGASLEAIKEICGAEGTTEAALLSLLLGLVEKSLVLAQEQDGETRYWMLETLRQHSREKLREAGEERPLRGRHLAWLRDLAERGERARHGAESSSWRRRLQHEVENFRVGLAWARIEPSEREAGLGLAAALSPFWWFGGQMNEGLEWLQELLAGVPANAGRVKALAEAANLCVRRGDPAAAEVMIQEALPLARRIGDRALIALVLTNVCQVRLQSGDVQAAEAASEEALPLFRELGGGPGLYYQLVRHGRVMEVQGRWDRSLACCEEALELARAEQNRRYMCIVLCRLGNLLLEAGKLAAARERLQEGLLLMQEIALAPSATPALSYLAGLAAAEGDPLAALKLAGAAVGLRQGLGGRILPSDRALLERRLQPVYKSLDPAVAEAAWNEGAAMSLDDAVRMASRQVAAQLDAAPLSPGHPGGLTPREREVVELIVRGHTNRQIAASLVISERTAGRHVENILSKLHLTSRAQVAVWAVEHGLTQPSEHPIPAS